jgi:hemerythrin
MTLREERSELVKSELNTYDADAFPGSAQWMKNRKFVTAIKEFDAAHPEIIAELKAEKKASDDAKFDKLSDFVKSGS